MVTRLLRSGWGRLAIGLIAVATIILGAAALLHFVFDEYGSFGGALWSSTKHVLDPSSLQDDEGAPKRVIGLLLVITGLVLLVGLLFTVISETVGRSIERIAHNERPVRAEDHLVAIGGLDLAPETPQTLVRVGRPEKLPKDLVLLAPEDARESRDELLGVLRSQLDAGAVGDRRHVGVLGIRAGLGAERPGDHRLPHHQRADPRRQRRRRGPANSWR